MTEEQISTEVKANNLILFAALFANVVLFIVMIYQGAQILIPLGETLPNAMYMVATHGSIYATLGIVVCLLIGILNRVNEAIGTKAPLVKSIAGILLKIPVNFILVCVALWTGFIGYGKYDVGVTGSVGMGGDYIIDGVSVLATLFLVFFVRKI